MHAAAEVVAYTTRASGTLAHATAGCAVLCCAVLAAVCWVRVCPCCLPAQVLLDCIIEEYHCLRKAASISGAVPTGCNPDSPSGSDNSSKIKAA